MLVVAECEQLPVPQARAGDPAAWDTLFRRYQLPLYVYVFEMVRDEEASLDIVQETFISAVRHLESLRQDEKFGSWLFGIAHQKGLQRWRKRGRGGRVLEGRVALEAAVALVRLGSTRGLEILCNAIDNPRVDFLRMEAVLALSELAGTPLTPHCAQVLSEYARSERFIGNKVRQAAIWGLGKDGLRTYPRQKTTVRVSFPPGVLRISGP
jgi:DNA-directed RNA polymerase specialized sigma24 family protein